jgi:hypothetical protein
MVIFHACYESLKLTDTQVNRPPFWGGAEWDDAVSFLGAEWDYTVTSLGTKWDYTVTFLGAAKWDYTVTFWGRLLNWERRDLICGCEVNRNWNEILIEFELN